MRLIDADAAIAYIKAVYCADCNSYNGVICRGCSYADAILAAPTIDAEPVRHGRWEWYEEPYDSRNPDGDYGWRCSECKQDLVEELTLGIPGMHYAYDILDNPEAPPTLKRCLFCGAKMDAKED